MNGKITIPQLQKIVYEEIKQSMREGIDHASIRDVVNAASKLLAALEAFKKDANGAMTNALVTHIEPMEATLSDMVSTPGSYVDKKVIKKVVSLKPVGVAESKK